MIKKIVLTGGPSAGKSSSLEFIRKYYSELGYKVYILSETATDLMNSGIIPNQNNLSVVEFQEIIFKYQLFKENLVLNIVNNNNFLNNIIIFDRGVIDNKAFINDEEFEMILKKYKYIENELLSRYDLVIHLETGAKSNYYRTDNNSCRRESVDLAIKLDNLTYKAWQNHNNLVKIECYDNFYDKQNKIINVIDKELNSKKLERVIL